MKPMESIGLQGAENVHAAGATTLVADFGDGAADVPRPRRATHVGVRCRVTGAAPATS
jgi:hypothetical protein